MSPGSCRATSCVAALKPETVLQMIAVEDIGEVRRAAFTHAAG